jgi:hypothetical protein
MIGDFVNGVLRKMVSLAEMIEGRCPPDDFASFSRQELCQRPDAKGAVESPLSDWKGLSDSHQPDAQGVA